MFKSVNGASFSLVDGKIDTNELPSKTSIRMLSKRFPIGKQSIKQWWNSLPLNVKTHTHLNDARHTINVSRTPVLNSFPIGEIMAK